MTETLLALMPGYGLWLVAATTFLSCLALPVPSSMVMLAAGAFASSGDIDPVAAVAASLSGAVLGDQAGFAAGLHGGRGLLGRLAQVPARAAAIDRARSLIDRHAGAAIFLTRWLFSPVGPYANFVAGAGGLEWARFTVWSVLGETIWVTLYTGMGWLFAGQIEAAVDLIANALGLLAGLAATAILGLWLRMLARHHV